MTLEQKLEWQVATVTSVHDESPRVKLFRLNLATSTPFRAGQYFDIRLTAPDGYQAQRSYSVTSAPETPESIEFAIELISDGEVSSYFHEAVEPGEKIELRGPIGGHFTWSPTRPKPVLLIGGGSGVAPLISMLRHRRSHSEKAPTALMFSARTESDLLFHAELEDMATEDPDLHLRLTLTREKPDNWQETATHESRRIDRTMLESAIVALGETPYRAYICGGSGFVETISTLLLDLGLEYRTIRTERFGP